MQVEIWSDVVCPWCYIGKRRFETALARFPHRDEVTVVWRAFELDPTAPAVRDGDPAARLAEKYGMTVDQAAAAQKNLTALGADEGLDFHLAEARSGNTFDAHRLLHLASELGVQDALKERLFAGYFVEGEAIGDHETLVRLAAEVGIDPERTAEVLEGAEYGSAVREEETTAQGYGIQGVPFFVFDRKYGVSGAQSPEHLEAVLAQTWEDANGLTMVPAGGAAGACEGDNCEV